MCGGVRAAALCAFAPDARAPHLGERKGAVEPAAARVADHVARLLQQAELCGLVVWLFVVVVCV